jgi:transcriptional regulator GlxA family with amidase domain
MQRVGLVIYPGFNVLSLAPLAVLEFANIAADSPAYAIELLSEAGGPVASSVGVTVETAAVSRSGYDTLIIASGTDVVPTSPGLVEILREAPSCNRRVVAACTGWPKPGCSMVGAPRPIGSTRAIWRRASRR